MTACRHCGREFDPGTDYTGKRMQRPQRTWCSLQCCHAARLQRRRDLTAARQATVDEVAVQRAIHGDRIPLTRAETRAAFAWLNGHGHSAAEIARRLRVTPRTVHRWRAASVRELAS